MSFLQSSLALHLKAGMMTHFILNLNKLANNAMAGNSINGPITKARAIVGRSGKAVTAMASAMGELRAKVEKLKPIDAAFSIRASLHVFILKNKFDK